MASEESAKSAPEALDVISNRISLALAKHDSLVKSWTAASSRQKKNEKTEEELEAEDIALFHKTPTYLGVGATIPSHFLISDAERNNKSLRAKFFPTKGLRGSKPRDDEEKAASAKRAKVEDSSDEEGGRSSLGKAKKQKKTTDLPSRAAQVETKSPVKSTNPAPQLKANPNPTIEEDALKGEEKEETKELLEEDNASSPVDLQSTKSAADRRKEKKRLKKQLKRKEKKNKK